MQYKKYRIHTRSCHSRESGNLKTVSLLDSHFRGNDTLPDSKGLPLESYFLLFRSKGSPLERGMNIIFYLSLLFIFSSCAREYKSEEIYNIWRNSGNKNTVIKIINPFNESLFPPEFPSPTFFWEETNKDFNSWIVVIEQDKEFKYISPILRIRKWKLDPKIWEKIKSLPHNNFYNITIIGFDWFNHKRFSNGTARFAISDDSVGAPIFYRSVPLPFSFAVRHLDSIEWKLLDISNANEPKTVLKNMKICSNCHSFSANGKSLGMDIDYGNDKGSYITANIEAETKLYKENIFTWNDYKREDNEYTFGFLSQVSPDGRYIISTVKDRSIFVSQENIYFSQLFFPIKGILIYYDSKTKEFYPLKGADDRAYVQSNGSWSPDGKTIYFARANSLILPEADTSRETILPPYIARDFIRGKRDFKYDIYTIPFNNGKGGKSKPLAGASGNGLSNYFPRCSPDGKWLVFCQANNFMLLQPDSKLYIMPSNGGIPLLMNCNTSKMNSWHSWSPNSKWLAFSSKAFGPYTNLFISHIDSKGMDSPPVWLENAVPNNRAVNIPEFVNIRYSELEKIIY